ncbi:nitroreductase family protein [Amycolatopsis sp. GM8]|uniref:Acg family FMN-binding oxidoreductase n=1 Tax=Amycolatopsis sp. GM8 TaxID=2896530 RepID=UPI001F375CB6|nr:nitroreductase family protein [Amycolatopsis sp. GM8]
MTWSATEVGVLARAAERAPSVHNTRPWALEMRVDGVDLFERPEAWLPRHDPGGRDRTISCGAALANLRLAVRALGWDVKVSLFPQPVRADLVARIVATEHGEPSESEVVRYTAIFRRRSYRAPFGLHPVPATEVRELIRADVTEGTGVHALRWSDAPPLAELLGYTASMLRGDRAYQRELQAWSDQFREPLPDEPTLPWGGLVRPQTRVPDVLTLTERLREECLLVVLTDDDSRRDHLLAGVALQEVWLTAVARGLAGSVLTQPLQLPEVRAGLIERLGLPGHPQAILRLGYPVTAPPIAARAARTTGAPS